jgi:hypothetical protein
MFCSFFDLSGNPPRISPTESMSPALNSGRLILLDLICRSAARILVGPVHEAEVGAAHRVAFEARGCHPDHGRKMGILDVGAETKVSSGGCYQAMGFLDAYLQPICVLPNIGLSGLSR